MFCNRVVQEPNTQKQVACFSAAIEFINTKKPTNQKTPTKPQPPKNLKPEQFWGEAESNSFPDSQLIQSLSISKLLPHLCIFCIILSHKYSMLFHKHVIILVNDSELTWNQDKYCSLIPEGVLCEGLMKFGKAARNFTAVYTGNSEQEA